MRKLLLSVILVAGVAVSCQREPSVVVPSDQERTDVEISTNYRSYDEALDIAVDAIETFYGNDTRHAGKRRVIQERGQVVMRSATRSNVTDDEPLMYIFNNEDNMGFTIVSANRSTQPLIAVTEQGNYIYGTTTGVEPFDLYITDVEAQLMSLPTPIPLPNIPLVPTPGCVADTIYYHNSTIDALLTTKWGQGGIYGNLCPNGLSGCSITAAVQIMAFHKHPDFLFTSYLGANNFDVMTIDWDELLFHVEGRGIYDFGVGQYMCNCGCNHEQISMIMREIGHRAGTEYIIDDPSTTDNEARSPTVNLDIYNELCLLGFGNPLYQSSATFDDFQDEIFENLDNSRPIFIAGFSETYGHAWVIDGYDYLDYRIDYYKANPNYNPSIGNNPEPEYVYDLTREYKERLLHFNWGWDGNCDGWFAYGCFAPGSGETYDDDGESNSSSRNYNRSYSLIYNIYPSN